jgi:[CysO sulfur-carrier protein]-S-L-cysteine hydrolase
MSAVTTEDRVIQIPKEIRDRMIAQAVRCLPNEACGLLAGADGRAERFYPMRNADHSALTYRLDPKEQLEVFEEIEQQGWQLFGIFHSHTHTEAYPSETDLRQAFYPEAHYILVSMAAQDDPVLRGFTIRDGMVQEQDVRIT